MAVYNVDKLMSEARKLAADYRQATGKPLGISGEIAVHDVIRLMKLIPSDPNQGGYDAIGTGEREGRRIQIKGRTIATDSKSSQRLGQIKAEQEWDSVMLILLDECYQPIQIYEAEREVILDITKQTSNKRKSRGAMSVGKFKHIGSLVWEIE